MSKRFNKLGTLLLACLLAGVTAPQVALAASPFNGLSGKLQSRLGNYAAKASQFRSTQSAQPSGFMQKLQATAAQSPRATSFMQKLQGGTAQSGKPMSFMQKL